MVGRSMYVFVHLRKRRRQNLDQQRAAAGSHPKIYEGRYDDFVVLPIYSLPPPSLMLQCADGQKQLQQAVPSATLGSETEIACA